MPLFPFNPAQFDYAKGFEKLPAGWYPVVIFESEIVPTKNNDGFRLIFKYKVIDGPGKDRIFQSGHNIQNASTKAVEISMSEIKTISACVGKFAAIQQSEELHNIPLQIRLTDNKDSDYNEVKGWKDINGNDPGKGGQGAPVQHQQQPPQGYGQPPQQQTPYGAPPPQQQYAPQQTQYQPQPPAPAAPPAWAPPAAAPQQQPQQYAPQQQAQQPAAPAWTPGAQPQAPAWAPPR